MGKHGSARHLNHLYPHPVPVEVYLLPEVYPHNPVLWLYFAYKLASYLCYSPTANPVEVIADGAVFKVTTDAAMLRLWRQGFYGKGVLLRLEPTWRQRQQATTTETAPALELVTVARRHERQAFKQQRALLQQMETRHRNHQLSAAEVEQLHQLRATVEDLRKREPGFIAAIKSDNTKDTTKDKPISDATSTNTITIDDASDDTVNASVDTTSVADLEYLQLLPAETLFLLNLGSITITPHVTATDVSRQLGPRGRAEYAVYHYFRSLGWCVRDGLKFGTEFLLYKRGPVFGHAEYAIKVISCHHRYLWTEMATVARVIGTVNKTLVVCFVHGDVDNDDDISDGVSWVKQYQVAPVMYRRWNPSRTRD